MGLWATWSKLTSPATISPQVNTTLPARTLLLGWGPYAILYLYAVIADVTSISPKLQMVQILLVPKARPLSVFMSPSHLISLSGFMASVSVSSCLCFFLWILTMHRALVCLPNPLPRP